MTIEEFKQLLAEQHNLINEKADAGLISSEQMNKFNRSMQIFESVMNTSEAVTRQINLIPFAKRGRRITSNFKRKKARWRAKMGLILYMGAVIFQTINSQPIPKYPKGGLQKGGEAIVGSMGQEITTEGLFDKVVRVNVEGKNYPDFFQGFEPRNLDLFVLPPDWNS